MSKEEKYSATDIEVLKGLDPVRQRPGMFTDTACPNHLIYEVVDNSVDEVLNGNARCISVTLHADGSVTVRDDGRGMPVDVHPGERIPGVELILTRLHAGAKFSGRQYRYSGGLHGVGVSVVNALSKCLEVWVRRNGSMYHMAFQNGKRKTKLHQVQCKTGTPSRGTEIRFSPDARYFDTVQINKASLSHTLQAKAVLCPGLKITLRDEQSGKTYQWSSEDRLDSYLVKSQPGGELLPSTPLHGTWRGEDAELEWVLAWVMGGAEPLGESYVNLVPTAQGGTHVNGLRKGVVEALREFCGNRGLLPRSVRLKPEDFFGNCAYVLSIRMINPQFTGQTKERLSSREATGTVCVPVREQLLHWLHSHVSLGEKIVVHAVARAERRSREEQRSVLRSANSTPTLPGKLIDCTDHALERSELFLVEGDSAGGSARQARDREFQAVMPLRGKIINTWELDNAALVESKEVHDVALAIGVSPGSPDLSGLRYGKVCILADADSDGAHIISLLCALFFKHFRPLVAEGHVYVAMPPLYRVDIGKQVHYALDDSELEILLANSKSKPQVIRFKGLGEMSPVQLRETTMLPGRRRLVQLLLPPGDAPQELMDMLLARRRTQDRRHWLETRGNLAGRENPYSTADTSAAAIPSLSG